MLAGALWKPGPGTFVLLALFATALVLVLIRFIFGLGAIANINDAYPWGWWIGFGVLFFISLGGCGFTLALMADVFGIRRFEPFVRPGMVCALLLYLSYLFVLSIEVGRPWMGWIVFLSFAHTSALWEIAWCATLYMACLILEFTKVAAAKYQWPRALRVATVLYLPAVVLGVTLSHFHQASLGTMMTIVPLKLDERWWSELLPLTFLLTAFSSGMSVVVIEHVLATRWLRLKPRPDLVSDLARFQMGVVIVFLLVRFGDLIYRGALESMLRTSWSSFSIWLELVVGFVVPLALLATPAIRNTLWGCFTASCLLIFGNGLMRLNITVVGMEVPSWQTYFPSAGEVLTTVGVFSGALLIYMVLLRVLPIHEEPPLDEAEPEPAARPAIGVRAEAL